ncbi:hypothetical protein [Streptomyces sp. NPDC058157]|uniref:hypothetical protein n=1 Tax=Streptomyces sp. NPDC058157 TaxID=3346360 RepID=UPI0036E5B687
MAGEDELSGWAADVDADALAALAGATVSRLTAPGAGPCAVLGGSLVGTVLLRRLRRVPGCP